MSYDEKKHSLDDVEKGPTTSVAPVGSHDEVYIPRDKGVFKKLWDLVQRFDRWGLETSGIERKLPSERTQKHLYDSFTMWFAANCTVSTFSLGTLGASVFGLDLRPAILTILFFNLLSTLPVALFSTFGPKLGLRQMTLSRFSFGYWTNYIPVVLNLIACIGWSTINSIVGGETLRAVSQSHRIPEAAAIVIIAAMTLVVSFMGYKFVHIYEKYTWIPALVIFIIIAGEGIPHMTTQGWNEANPSPVEAASVLSFGAAIVGQGLGWVSLAADYSVNYPEDSPSWKLFLWTYAGLNIPTVLIESLGAGMMTTFLNKPTWEERYLRDGIGGLLGAGLSPLGGFGQFLLVLLALSIVGNNIPNLYSFALTFQALGPVAQAIPRMFLVLVGTGIYIALAIVGANHFESWLDTMLVILSYWLAIYASIVIEEHFIFRKGRFANYRPDEFNNWRLLPLGVASFLALGCGVAGAVLGMAQVWYVGVIGKKIGIPAFGGDIGFELSAGFTCVTYPIFRYFELKYWGH
ncbi:hypothetical protein BT69DRAFT_1261642 [Atractiella rhizophila]|nr:hypothetical protein BT69DRAFT_1261642 [Atractiella rhizophila]